MRILPFLLSFFIAATANGQAGFTGLRFDYREKNLEIDYSGGLYAYGKRLDLFLFHSFPFREKYFWRVGAGFDRNTIYEGHQFRFIDGFMGNVYGRRTYLKTGLSFGLGTTVLKIENVQMQLLLETSAKYMIPSSGYLKYYGNKPFTIYNHWPGGFEFGLQIVPSFQILATKYIAIGAEVGIGPAFYLQSGTFTSRFVYQDSSIPSEEASFHYNNTGFSIPALRPKVSLAINTAQIFGKMD